MVGGFRLASAVACFAKRTSHNLDALQTKADDATKTAAKRFADEALLVRKARLQKGADFDKSFRKLKQQFGMHLNSAQLEAIMYSGPEGVENLISTVNNAQMEHAFAVQQNKKLGKFDVGSFLNNEVFKLYENQVLDESKVRTPAQIREDYLANVAPMIQPNMSEIVKDIQTGTQTAMFGGIDPKYISASLGTQMGQLPKDYTGPEAQLQYQVNLSNLSPTETLAYLQGHATLQQTQVGTDVSRAQIGQIQAATQGALLANAEKLITNKFVGAKEQAAIAKIKSEISYTEVKEDEVKINTDLIKKNVELLNKYGGKEKEAAMALIKAQIEEKGTMPDLESLYATVLNKKMKLQAQVQESGFRNQELDNQILFYEHEAASLANTIQGIEGASNETDLFSKVSEQSRFNNLLVQNLNINDIALELSDFDGQIEKFAEGRNAEYFDSFRAAIIQFSSIYTGKRGQEFTYQMQDTYNNALQNFASQTPNKRIVIKPLDPDKDTWKTSTTTGKVIGANIKSSLATGEATSQELSIDMYSNGDPRNDKGIILMGSLTEQLQKKPETGLTGMQATRGATINELYYEGQETGQWVIINDYWDDNAEFDPKKHEKGKGIASGDDKGQQLLKPVQKIAIWDGGKFIYQML